MSRPLLLLVLTACGGDPDGTAPTDTGGSKAGTTSTDEITHDADLQKIWEAHCGPGCHTSGAADGGLNLDDAYDKIVGVPSGDVPSMNYVEPGSLEDSYLWHKLEGTQGEVGGLGLPMPRTGELGNAKRDKIEAWILAGAPR